MKTLLALLVVCGIALSAVVVQAADMTCAWQPNTEADLLGYRLFQRLDGGSYDYESPIAKIPAGTETCTVTGLPDGDYRWVLRAFDDADNESADSNEASLLVDDPPGVVTGFG